MRICDYCKKEIPKPAFCDMKCQMAYRRSKDKPKPVRPVKSVNEFISKVKKSDSEYCPHNSPYNEYGISNCRLRCVKK